MHDICKIHFNYMYLLLQEHDILSNTSYKSYFFNVVLYLIFNVLKSLLMLYKKMFTYQIKFAIICLYYFFLLKDRPKGAGGNNMRDKTTIKRLQMYRNFKAKR